MPLNSASLVQSNGVTHNSFILQIDPRMFNDSNGPILRMPNEIFLDFSVTFFPNIVAITTIAVAVSVAVFLILFSVLIAFIIYWKRFATITSDKNMFIKYPCI